MNRCFSLFPVFALLLLSCSNSQPEPFRQVGVFLLENEAFLEVEQGWGQPPADITATANSELSFLFTEGDPAYLRLFRLETTVAPNEMPLSITRTEEGLEITPAQVLDPGGYCFTEMKAQTDNSPWWCFAVVQESIDLPTFTPAIEVEQEGLHLLLSDVSVELSKERSVVEPTRLPLASSRQPIVLLNTDSIGVTSLSLVQVIAGLGFGWVDREDLVAVGSITENSAAENAGLEVGDTLVAVDGEPVNGDRNKARQLIIGEPGTSVNLSVIRGAQTVNVEAMREVILEYAPLRLEFAARGEYLLLRPYYPVLPGVYCYVDSTDVSRSSESITFWCFRVE